MQTRQIQIKVNTMNHIQKTPNPDYQWQYQELPQSPHVDLMQGEYSSFNAQELDPLIERLVHSKMKATPMNP